MSKVGLTLSVMFAFAACAKSPPVTTPASTAASPATSRTAAPAAERIAIRVPQDVAEFTLHSRHDYEDKSLGVQLRYRGPDSLLADVFVYPGPDMAKECPAACASELLATEVRNFDIAMQEMVNRGTLQSKKLVASQALTPPPGASWRLGHHLTFALTRAGRAKRSDFDVFHLPGYRVKVRATYVESDARPADLREFVEALIPALVGGAPPPK